MSMFKEVQETDKPIETEKQRLSTAFENNKKNEGGETRHLKTINEQYEGQKYPCLLYTSDAADEEDSGDLGGRRTIKKKKKKE